MWNTLSSLEALEDIKSSPNTHIIFKHSTRCTISDRVKKIFEKDYKASGMHTPIYLIDILQNRSLSNAASELFHIHHESPQLLLIHNGECVFAPSHADISVEEIQEEIAKITNIQS